MARIKLTEQPSYGFRHSITLYPRDINYGGHLGNDSLVSLLGSARALMFHTMGFSEGNLGDGKTGIIMADLVVNFRSEAFIFDEIHIDSHIGEMRPSGFRIYQRVTRNGTIIALAETGTAAFDYVSRRIAHIPDEFLKALGQAGN